MSKNTDEKPDWFQRNWHGITRILRIVAALHIIWLVVWPVGEELRRAVANDLAQLFPTTKTGEEPMIPPSPPDANKVQLNPTTKTAAPPTSSPPSPDANTAQPKDSVKEVKKLVVVRSAAPRVWAYGLQLAALISILLGSLWSVVLLCREDQ